MRRFCALFNARHRALAQSVPSASPRPTTDGNIPRNDRGHIPSHGVSIKSKFETSSVCLVSSIRSSWAIARSVSGSNRNGARWGVILAKSPAQRLLSSTRELDRSLGLQPLRLLNDEASAWQQCSRELGRFSPLLLSTNSNPFGASATHPPFHSTICFLLSSDLPSEPLFPAIGA